MGHKKIRTIALAVVLSSLVWGWPTRGAAAAEVAPEQAIFPGQAEPEISAGIIEAYNLALNRDYEGAKKICLELGRKFPDNPAGPTGEMVLYQVMMLENEDYQYDAEFRDAAARAVERVKIFSEKAPRNDWYYTLVGAAWGIQGIYFLRRDEYMSGLYYGVRGLDYMQTAADMNDGNMEAKLGIGLYLYYRSAYASFIPIDWFDQREKGIAMVKRAGRERPYLEEVSRIALYYIRVNEKDWDGAREYMDGLIAERPEFPIFYQLAGRAMMGKKDWDAAADYYMKMREIDPTLYLPAYKLGQIALERGDKAKAREWFEEFFRVLGNRESVYRKPAKKYLDALSG